MNHQIEPEPTDTSPSPDAINEPQEKEGYSKEVVQAFNLVGSIAGGLKKSIFYVLISGVGAISYLSWQWIDFSTSFTWIILKLLPFLAPLALWGLLYFVISELAELPSLVKIAKTDGENAIQSIKNRNEAPEKPKGFFGKLKSLFRVLRGAGNLSAIVGAVQGVALIANPIFALLIFISGLVLSLLIFIALLVLIF